MKIIRSNVLGFCFGVRRAMEFAEQALEQNNGIVYSLGPLIHNESALAELEKKGLHTLAAEKIDEIPEGAAVIIRAHGVSPQVIQKLRQKNCKIIDATCPRVKASQKMVERAKSPDDYIIITGDKNHGEMIAIAGFASGNFIQIQNEEEAAALDLPDSDKIKVILMSQTTFSINEFQKIREILVKKFHRLTVMNTICPATSERQTALQELCSQVEGVLVVGGKNSANTRRLYQIAAQNCKHAAHIQTAADIPQEFFHLQSVGITAGASTPDNIIKAVENALKGF